MNELKKDSITSLENGDLGLNWFYGLGGVYELNANYLPALIVAIFIGFFCVYFIKVYMREFTKSDELSEKAINTHEAFEKSIVKPRVFNSPSNRISSAFFILFFLILSACFFWYAYFIYEKPIKVEVSNSGLHLVYRDGDRELTKVHEIQSIDVQKYHPLKSECYWTVKDRNGDELFAVSVENNEFEYCGDYTMR